LNVGVTHQLHERGQAYPGTYHIGGKGVSKTMRVGELNASATDANPIVILIVRLLAAAAVADDRIPLTCRASL